MESPYREGKPLRDVIPPDRRRQRALLTFGGGALFGVAVWLGIGALTAKPAPTEVVIVEAPVSSPTRPPSPDEPPPLTPRERTPAEIERVIASYRGAVFQACWERAADPKLSSATVTLAAVVGERGDVVSITAKSDAPLLAGCVEDQVRGWRFPATGLRQTVQIPFVFRRQ